MQEKRNKWWWWIAEHGWVKYFKLPKAPDAVIETENGTKVIDGEKFEIVLSKHGKEIIKEKQQIDPLPTEIKMDKNNQLSLF